MLLEAAPKYGVSSSSKDEYLNVKFADEIDDSADHVDLGIGIDLRKYVALDNIAGDEWVAALILDDLQFLCPLGSIDIENICI